MFPPQVILLMVHTVASLFTDTLFQSFRLAFGATDSQGLEILAFSVKLQAKQFPFHLRLFDS